MDCFDSHFYPIHRTSRCGSLLLSLSADVHSFDDVIAFLQASIFTETTHTGGTAGSTVFPMPVSLGASWNTSLMEAIGTAIALEMRSAGFDQGLSPILQVRRSKPPLSNREYARER